MPAPDLIIRSRRVVTPVGVHAASIHLHGGKIVGVLGFDDAPAGVPLDDAGDDVVMPGVVEIGERTGADALRLVHAECAPPGGRFDWWRDRSYASYLDARPKTLENDAIDRLIEECRRSRVRTHIVGLSSSDTLTPLFRARTEGLPISASTCPHYLYFAAEEIAGAGHAFRCEPPIRGRENRELLWAAFANGLVSGVTPGALTPSELSLAVVWTVAHGRGHGIEQLIAWMCRTPAQLAGLSRKGKIDVGYDADLAVFDSEAMFTAEAAPYAGRRLRGVVQRAYQRGVTTCLHKTGWT